MTQPTNPKSLVFVDFPDPGNFLLSYPREFKFDFSEFAIPGGEAKPVPPVEVNGHQEFEVEYIVDSKRYHGSVRYLVHWKGYTVMDRTWEPPEHLDNAQIAVEEFHQEHPNKPRPPKFAIPGGEAKPVPPVEVNGHQEFEVEYIVDSKRYHGSVRYLVHWKGYTVMDRTWEPPEHLDNAQIAVEEFHQEHPNKPRPPKFAIPGGEAKPVPPVEVNGHQEFEVEYIVDSKRYHGSVRYLVHWKGYTVMDRTWEPPEHLDNAQIAVEEFHQEHPNKPRQPKFAIPGGEAKPVPPVEVNGHQEFEVEYIVDSKRYHGSVRYLVHWKGYTVMDRTWEPPEHLDNAQIAVEEFHQEHPNKPRPQASQRSA